MGCPHGPKEIHIFVHTESGPQNWRDLPTDIPEEPLFKNRRTGGVIPNCGKVFTKFYHCLFLSRAERLWYSSVRTEFGFDFIDGFELRIPT